MPVEPIYKERELLLLLSKGNQAAFEKIYYHYSAKLLGNITRLVKSESVAAELLQELFIKLWNNRESIDPDKSFCAYLFRIAENLAYDYFRKVSKDNRLQEQLINMATGQYVHVEELLYHKENTFALREAIAALPEQRRKVFELVKLEGRSYEEVSSLLNISCSTISDHIVKATKFIRERLGGRYELAIGVQVLLFTGALCSSF